MAENLAALLRLMLVTDDALVARHDLVAACREAIAGGVTMVQLRLKHASDRDLLAQATALVQQLPVPVLINDRLDIALLAGAAGVHLGADDLAPAIARGLAPKGFLIGASVGSMLEVDRGREADFWGIGPLRQTRTKLDAGNSLGWDGVEALVKQAAGKPAVVIGGVVASDVAESVRRGLAGVAVVSAILGAADLRRAAAEFTAVRGA